MVHMKLSFLKILAFFIVMACPLTLSSQNASAIDTSPRTQEEADRIHKHGSLPKYSRLSGPNLRDKLKKSHGNPAEVVIGEGLLMNSLQDHPDFAHEWMRDQLCRADCVVVVRMARQISGLTSNESLVDSDYYFTLEQVVHSRGTSNDPAKGSTIIVNSLGGTIDLPEGRASTVIQGLTSFEPGKRYLIFLKNIPSTGDYEPTDLGGAVSLPERGSPKSLYEQTEEGLEHYLLRLDSQSLINQITDAGNTLSGCKGAAQ